MFWAERHAAISYAGRQAQERFLGRTVENGFEVDYANALRVLEYAHAHRDPSGVIVVDDSRALTMAREIVERHWLAISRLAARLVAHGELDGQGIIDGAGMDVVSQDVCTECEQNVLTTTHTVGCEAHLCADCLREHDASRCFACEAA